MAWTFSYTFDLSSDKKIARFKTENGDIYELVHELTWTIYGNSILNITVDCSVANDILIVAELCSASINSLKSNALLHDNRALLSFQNVNFLTPDPWRCLIHVVPHVALHDVQDSTLPSPVVAAKGSVVKKAKLDQLSADMQRILNTGDLSDVILTDGTIKIPAHKVVLSARSPVFSRMFQHQMKENFENLVFISDLSGNVLKEFVSFMYSGIVSVEDMKMARNLYIAADKYAVTDLKSVCSDALKNVTIDDCLDILALADLYEDKELKDLCLNFISRNYSLVKSGKNWGNFVQENQTLVIEILSFIVENKA